jgi:DNA polymerase-1
MGWSPEKFTKTGQPKTDEESIKAYVETLGPDPRAPQVLAIADWLVYNGRANMVNTWLNEVKDDYIHGSVFSCGAASRRCTHSHPNTANIPSNEAKYGPECRGFWKAREGRVLLGYDAKSAQMRLFGHYLRNPEATRFYLGEFGDPHAKNGLDAGIPRGRAKNCFYALIFGAQDPRLGLTAGGDGTPLLGKRVRGALYKNTPGLEGAMREAEELYKEGKGWLPCLDGGFVRCPSPHSALNYLIQPAEAVLMKLTAIYLDQKAQKRGIDHLKVGDIHDEAQHDCLDRATAEALGEIAVETMPEAGEELGITVKMEASYKIGLSWADTH